MQHSRPPRSKRSPIWLRHPVFIVVGWMVISLGLGMAGYLLGTQTEIPGPANRLVLEQIEGERAALQAGIPPRDLAVLLLRSSAIEIGDAQFVEAREKLVATLTAARVGIDHAPLFDHVITAGHSIFSDDKYISQDNHTLLIQAVSHRSIDEAAADLMILPELIVQFRAQHPLFTISYLSPGTVNNEVFAIINRDLDRSLYLTLPITFGVLLWVFRSLVAAVLPLAVAGVSLVSSLGVAALFSAWTGPISATAAQLVVLLVLAIGIDYALFFISRIREWVALGESYHHAILLTRASTGTAILWSGLVVALSLAGLYLMLDSVLSSMATVAIVAVLITMLGAVFVLPALLLLLGDRLEWGRIPYFGRRGHSSSPNRWIQFAIRRPLAAALSSIAVLIVTSWFAFSISLGSTVEPPLLPLSSQSYRAYQELKQSFPDLAGVDFSILFYGSEAASLEEEGSFEGLLAEVQQFGGISGPLQTVIADDGTVVRYQFLAMGSANDRHNKELIRLIRERWLPSLVTSEVGVSVSGTLPYAVDAEHAYRKRTPMVFCVVISLSAVFLLVAFRSIVIPIKAMALNLLSTGAAFGFLAITFQRGIFGSQGHQVIESFVPGLLFSILFGLSMDYHVFLLSRLREEVEGNELCHGYGDNESLGGRYSHDDQSNDNRSDRQQHTIAVGAALESTFATITGAASIMISVFAIIATLELPVMRQLGVGLGIAILLDATLIRCLLLPASLVLLGRHNWYLPKWLAWLPRVRLG